MHQHTCTVALLVVASLAGCVLSNDAAADNNIGWHLPITTYSVVSSSTPVPTSSVWVSAPATAGEQWTVQPAATAPGTVVTGMPSSPGRWQRRRRHQHQYPLQTVAAPAGAAAIVGANMPAGTSPMGPTTVSLPAGQPGSTTTAYIPGRGWVAVVWGTPAAPQQGAQGWPGFTGPGPQQPQPGMGGMGPPGQPGMGGMGPLGQPGMGGMGPPGQPGMGGMGPPGMSQPSPGGPSLPGGSMPGTSLGSGSGSASDSNSLAPDTPTGGVAVGSGGWAGGRSSSSGSGGGGWGSGVPAAGGSWGAWGGRRSGPAPPSSSIGSSLSDDDEDDSDDNPVWPWPGSPLSASPSPKPSSPSWGAAGAKPSPSPSPPPGSSWPGSGSPISSSTWSGSARPSPSPTPSSRWTPPSGPTVVTGPSKIDPDRPWLFPGRGASPSSSPRPGVSPPAGGSTGRAPGPPSPKPGAWPEGDANEWDEGTGDDGSDNAGMMRPQPKASPAAGAGGSMPMGGKPGGSAAGSPSPSPRPGSSSSAASGTGAFVTGLSPGGGLGPRASPSPRPSAAVTGGMVVVDVEDDDYEPAKSGLDVDIEVGEGEGDDADVPDVTAGSSSRPLPNTAAAGSPPQPLPTTATGQQQPPGPAMGRPGSGAGSVAPTGTLGSRPGSSAGMGAGTGPGSAGMGAGMRPGAGPGNVSTEAGQRAGSAGNASSTAGGQGGFVLSPTSARPTGTGAVGAGGPAQVVVPMGASPAASTMQGPKSVVIEAKGATKTVLLGCVLPFEGSDQTPVGKAVHAALLMALKDLGPTLKVPVNINLTCLNSKCLDIPAHNAMSQLVEAGAVAVVGDICSAASVAAAGVAGSKQVPLISPASSSPQLTGMPYFYRTVPSDRYQGAAAAALVIKKGVKQVGMVYEDSSYGYGLAFNFIASFTRDGGRVSPVEVFKKFQGDPQAAVAKMVEAKASKTDPIQVVVVSTNNITYFTEFLRAAAAAKLDLPILGGDAIASPKTADLLRDSPGLLKNVHITAFAQGSPAFQKKFAEVNPGLEYDGNAAQGYDAMHTLLRAYMDAPPPKEPQDIASQITKQKFTGVSGPIAFDSKGDLLPHDGVYITITFDPKTGEMVFGNTVDLPDF